MTKTSYRTLTVLTAVLLAALILAACGGSAQPEPTAVPVPTVVTPTGPTDLWQKVQQDGKMLVGTSADYAPFESYNNKFQLDGFDIALMKEIGKKLGVEVVFNDFAFDGLGGALTLGQIDAAIAAISVTPERRESVDFSDIYYRGVGAALAADTWKEGEITTPEELKTFRIGVQGGTVYESYAKGELANSKVMSTTNLLVFTDIKQAVSELKTGRVDVVLLDKTAAEDFVAQGGLKIVGEGVKEQDFAISIPKNQDAFRRVINQALGQLQADGTVAKLAKQYLGVVPEDIVPVPTAIPEPATPTPAPSQPTPTPAPTAPPAACVNGMAWVADLSYDDKNMTAPPVIPPGQPFVKSWRVRNSGTCTWNSSYFLGYDHGNVPAAQMGGQPVFVQGTVAPGATYDFKANLVAPTVPGVYQGFWQMRNGSNTAFGETIWVGIRVPAPAQPTPAPTQTPVTGITFTAIPDSIQQGQCSTVSWNVTNAREVYYYQNGQNWQNNGVAGQGTRTECPQQTTTYNLRVVLNDGSVQTRQVTVNVTPVVGAPLISQFSMTPPSPITLSQCINLQWSVQGNVTRVLLSRNNSPLWDAAPYQGSYQDCPPGAGEYTYVLQATGPGGTSQANQFLQVNASQPTSTPIPPTSTPVPPTPTPVPPTSTPVPQPQITSFTVQPGEIQPGQCVTVAWNTAGGTQSVDVTRSGATIVNNGPVSGSIQDCPEGPGVVPYQLIASNQAGTTVSQNVTINVTAPPAPTDTPAPPPLVGSWNLTNLNGNQVVPGTQITANFNNGQLTGSGGCNTYNTTYSTSGSGISINPPVATQMICEDSIMQQENAYLQTLTLAASYQLSGPTLSFYNGSGGLILQYSGAR